MKPLPARQQLAREFGATHIVFRTRDDGVTRIKQLTGVLGAHSVIDAAGTQESIMQAIQSACPGGHLGVTHRVQLPGEELFFSHVHLQAALSGRRFLPEPHLQLMRG